MPRARMPLASLAAAALLLTASDPGTAPDELERNRRLLEKWRADPEHAQRLRADLKAFRALPPERREKLRQLDRDLHEQDAAVQQRLWAVLDRYADWVARLPDEDRKRVEAAGDRAERLKVIRQVLDRQWVERQPRAERERLQQLPEDQRAAAVAALRRAERQRLAAWHRALRPRPAEPRNPPYRPVRLNELPADVQAFVNEQLRPMLSYEERDALYSAEGSWPGLALAVLDLSERHPVLPPPHGRSGVTRYDELPPELKTALPRKHLAMTKQWSTLRRKEGRWPDFALAFTDVLTREGKAVPPLGASRPQEFSPAVQEFLAARLVPALKEDEAARLKAAEGKWPDYPRALHELARAHGLVIPGMSLPGPRELWDAAKSSLPEVPDRVLREFLVGELTAEDRGRLQLSPGDPTMRERLKQEFFRKHPGEIKRWRRVQAER